jgi:Fuc2NAc and GlcNAc transferase
VLIQGIAVTVVAFAVALVGTWWTLRNAARLGLVQAPNERSSHVRPTPIGGGIGIVLGSLVAGGYAALSAPWPTLLIVAASLPVAAVGLRDDIRHVPAAIRLAAQLVLFGIVAFVLLPPLLAAPALIAGVLFINLFNFMDGIDGIAAMEAAFVVLVAGGLIFSADSAVVWWLIGIGAACLGFLVLNMPPARIFMGDVGSTLLGFMIAALAILLRDTLSIWVWLILAAVFVADGVVTLTRRLLQREKVYEAHRRHAYQILSRRFGSHRIVTLGAFAINVVWLMPLAIAAHRVPGLAPFLTMLAYLPLVTAALLVGAGKPQPGEV